MEPEGDLWKPDLQEVPFGTRGLVFRRRREVPESTLRVELTHAWTGMGLERAGVLLFQDKPMGARGWIQAGEDSASWRVCAISRYLAAAQGFREATGFVEESLDRSGEEPVLRAALLPGTSRQSWVVDWSSYEEGPQPVPGVAVQIDGELIGTTDACGLVRIDSDDPDPEVVFVHEGFERQAWYPQREWDEFLGLDHDCWKPGMTLIELRRKGESDGR